MELFAQQVLNGLVTGSVYSLVALGLTLAFEPPEPGVQEMAHVVAVAWHHMLQRDRRDVEEPAIGVVIRPRVDPPLILRPLRASAGDVGTLPFISDQRLFL